MKLQIAAIVMTSAVLAGCAVVQEKTFGESLDDASASSQVKSKLMAASAKTFAEVDVEVTGRLVLLTGRVATEQDKVDADRIAWSVRTIDEVANEIEVIPDTSLLKNLNDEWITAQVRSRLLGDAEIKGINYNIETFNGVVYLLGLAHDELELKRAAEHASLVKGVKKVVSYVKMRDRLPPASAYSSQKRQAPTPSYPVQPQPAPAQNHSAQSYRDDQLYGAPSQTPGQAQEVPFIDPANPNDVYDEDGFLMDRSGKSGSDAASQDGYADPYADPFGDDTSSN